MLLNYVISVPNTVAKTPADETNNLLQENCHPYKIDNLTSFMHELSYSKNYFFFFNFYNH
jgi:hypothetical protein